MALTCFWCSEQVIPCRKPINWWGFLLLLLLGVLGGILYLIFWFGKPASACPLCQGDVYGRFQTETLGGEGCIVICGVVSDILSGQTVPNEVIQREIEYRVARSKKNRAIRNPP